MPVIHEPTNFQPMIDDNGERQVMSTINSPRQIHIESAYAEIRDVYRRDPSLQRSDRSSVDQIVTAVATLVVSPNSVHTQKNSGPTEVRDTDSSQ